MQFASLQHDIAWEDPAATRKIIERSLEGCGLPAGSFLLLPELGETGFSVALDRVAGRGGVAWAAELARSRGWFVQVGHAEIGADRRGRNRATVIDQEGRVLGDYDKIHPFSFAGEDRHYGPGERILLVEAGGFTVCPLICYDLRFPELWRLAARAGAEVFTIGASWPAARAAHWRQLAVARAIENQAFVVACNRVGRDPNHAYAGGSLVVSPLGEILAEGGEAAALVEAGLDRSTLLEWRQTFPAMRDRRDSMLGTVSVDDRRGRR